MTLLASGLDGVSVWEILNKRQNQDLSASRAEKVVYETQLEAAEAEIAAARTEVQAMVQVATDMDNDGKGDNDHLIPGQLALIEAKRADLAGLVAAVAPLRAQVVSAAAIAAQNDTGRHVLLQMADKQEKPAQWLISRAAIVFCIPEFTLALLAWSLRSGSSSTSNGSYQPVQARGLAALTAMPEHQVQPQPQHREIPQPQPQAPLPVPRQHTEVVAAASPPAARRKTSHVRTRERERVEEPTTNEVSNNTEIASATPINNNNNRTNSTQPAPESAEPSSTPVNSSRPAQSIKAKRSGPSKLFSRGRRAHPEAGMVLNN
tara:strand:- start:15118 stop:16074 length:957 start_codon:yes stop_codon:yes gene_type:complete